MRLKNGIGAVALLRRLGMGQITEEEHFPGGPVRG